MRGAPCGALPQLPRSFSAAAALGPTSSGGRCSPPSVPLVPTCPAPALLPLSQVHALKCTNPCCLPMPSQAPALSWRPPGSGLPAASAGASPEHRPCRAPRDPRATGSAPAQAETRPHRLNPSPAGSPLHGSSLGSPRARPGRQLSTAGGCHGASQGFSSGLGSLRIPGADSLLLSHTPTAPQMAPAEPCTSGALLPRLLKRPPK